jgi:hypothetical protein
MFFFGGFGSIMPYIVYLSLMWICIIIGVRVPFRNVFGFQPAQELKIETVSVVVHPEEFVHYFDISIKSQKKAHLVSFDYFLSIDFTPIDENILHSGIYHASPLYARIIDASGLRAPPVILI